MSKYLRSVTFVSDFLAIFVPLDNGRLASFSDFAIELDGQCSIGWLRDRFGIIPFESERLILKSKIKMANA